jgi:hypothetical protein
LTTASNDFTGAVSLNNTGANAVSVTDTNAIVLGASTVGGSLTVSAGGAISQTGALTVAGTSSFSAGANTITLTNGSNDFTGAVSLSNSNNNDVSVTDVNALVLGASTLGRNLTVVANGAITQTGALTVGGTSSFTAGANAITLANASNNFSGAVSFSNSGSNAVSVTDVNAIVLGASTIGGNLTVIATGDITQTGALAVGGTSSFSAGANAITLTNASNNFTGAVSLNNSGNHDVSVTDTNALVLGTSSLGRDLTVVASGTITQTGALTVAGTSSFTAGANAITLTNASNDFSGAVSFSNSGANDVSVTDVNVLALGAGTFGGNLTVVTNGAITQAGALVVAGTSSFTAGANTITLTNASNNFTGAVSLSNSGSNAVSVTDTNAIVLGASTIGGVLTVVANGTITQTGAVVVAGTSSFTAGANAITLTHASNDFTGAVSFSNSGANDVSVTDMNAIALGAGTFGGNLTVVANGTITQAGALVVAGASSFTAGANAIILTNASNNFTGPVSFSNSGANDVSVTDTNAFVLDAGTFGGNLTVVTNGAITQTGALVVAGTSSFTAGANAITLANASNDFTGAVNLSNSGANAMSLRDANGLILGTLSAANGGITIVAGGNLTQAAGGSIGFTGGTVSLASGGDLTLSQNINKTGNADGAVLLSAAGDVGIGAAIQRTSGNGLIDLTVTADTDDNGGNIVHTGSILTNGGFASFQATGGGANTIQFAGNVNTAPNNGQGGGAITAVADGSVTQTAGTLNSADGATAITSNSGSFNQSGGSIGSDEGNITITAANGGILIDGAALAIFTDEGDLTLTAGQDIEVRKGIASNGNGNSLSVARLTADGAILITSTGSLMETSNGVSGAMDIFLESDADDSGTGDVTVQGQLVSGNGTVEIRAGVPSAGANGVIGTNRIVIDGGTVDAGAGNGGGQGGAVTFLADLDILLQDDAFVKTSGNDGNIDFEAGRDIAFSGTSSTQTGSGNQAFTATRDIVIDGAAISILSTQGSPAVITMDAGRDVQLLKFVEGSGSSDSLTINADNDILIGVDGGVGKTHGARFTVTLVADHDQSGGGDITDNGFIDSHGGDVTFTALGSGDNTITLNGPTNTGNGAFLAKADAEIAFGEDGTITASGGGDSVVLAVSTGIFTNNRGSDAITVGGGRWIIYTRSHLDNVYGGLVSGNQAIWGQTYASLPPPSVPSGNRYVFANSVEATVTALDRTKTYGDVIDYSSPVLGTDFSVTGLVDASAFGNVWEDAVILGAPVMSSAGAPATASVAGSPYTILISAGDLVVGLGYTLEFEEGTLTVERRGITITADSGQGKTYGEVDPTLTFTVGGLGLVNGDTLSGALARAAGENVGAYAINQGTLDAGDNYTITGFTGADFTISARGLTITADSGQGKTYGEVDPAPLTFTVGGQGLVGEDSLSGALARAAGENAGTYAINQGTLDAGDNYEITFVGADFTINRRGLTITANPGQSKIAGTPDPVFTFTVGGQGLVNQDSLSGGLSRNGGENPGLYALLLGNLDAGPNYEITFTQGEVFTIIGVVTPPSEPVGEVPGTPGAGIPDFGFLLNSFLTMDDYFNYYEDQDEETKKKLANYHGKMLYHYKNQHPPGSVIQATSSYELFAGEDVQ